MKPSKYLVIAAALMVLQACTIFVPPKASVDYKKGFDFGAVERIAFAEHAVTAGEDASVVSAVHAGLRDALADKGIEVVDDPQQAQLMLSWHLVTSEAKDVRSYNSEAYYRCWRCGPSKSDVEVQNITKGTFIVDMIDPGLSQSVWRGVMQDRMNPDASDAQRAQAIAIICREMLSRFPPGFNLLGGFST